MADNQNWKLAARFLVLKLNRADQNSQQKKKRFSILSKKHSDPASLLLQTTSQPYDLASYVQNGAKLCEVLQNMIKEKGDDLKLTFFDKPQKQAQMIHNVETATSIAKEKFGVVLQGNPSDFVTSPDIQIITKFLLDLRNAVESGQDLDGAMGYLQLEEEQAENDEDTLTDTTSDTDSTARQSQFLSDALGGESTDDGITEYYLSGAINLLSEINTDDVMDSKELNTETAPAYTAIKEAIALSTAEHSCLGHFVDDDVDAMYSPAVLSSGKRQHLLEELFQTEKEYLELLEMIEKCFMEPIKTSGKVDDGDVEALFKFVPSIREANRALYSGMSEEMSKTTGRNLSKCFLENSRAFRRYGPYCWNLQRAMTSFDKLSNDGDCKKLLDECIKKSGQFFSLRELLNVPMQRLLKYPLFIRSIFQSTPLEHPDKANLGLTVVMIERLASWVNDTKRAHDRWCNLYSSITGYSLSVPFKDMGYIVLAGFVSTESEGKKKKTRALLLSEGVLLCNAKGSRLRFHSFIPLLASTSVRHKTKDNLQLGLKNGADSLDLDFFSKQDKGLWIAAIDTCLKFIKDERFTQRRIAKLAANGYTSVDDKPDEEEDEDDDQSEDGKGMAKPYLEFAPRNLRVPIK
eukprot:m.136814 g.136814  ORF g.136814 m.136814 type:complete len:632 (+) comp14738_c0_seq2:125-2020(+)